MSHIYASILFDSKASLSFVSSTLVKLDSLRTQPMSQGIMVALPNEERVFYTNVAKGRPLEVGGVSLKANLIVFSTLGFNVILGMNWLFKHFASIYCHLRTTTFQVPEMEVRSLREVEGK